MAPNLEDDNYFGAPVVLNLSPLSTIITEGRIDEEIDEFFIDPNRIVVPLEFDLRRLLVKVIGSEDLQRVTQVRLRVIARDVPLQHLHIHLPALRELILDGSVVSTLRDLGCGLKNLTILRVNRCGLDCIDNMSGLEGLQEIYAADNSVRSFLSCCLLPNIKVIDLRRNRLKNIFNTLACLSYCEKLEHICLAGNDEIRLFPNYRQEVKSLLPGLRSLDGISYTEEQCNLKVLQEDGRDADQVSQRPQATPTSGLRGIIGTPRVRRTEIVAGFTISFPPNVITDKLN